MGTPCTAEATLFSLAMLFLISLRFLPRATDPRSQFKCNFRSVESTSTLGRIDYLSSGSSQPLPLILPSGISVLPYDGLHAWHYLDSLIREESLRVNSPKGYLKALSRTAADVVIVINIVCAQYISNLRLNPASHQVSMSVDTESSRPPLLTHQCTKHLPLTGIILCIFLFSHIKVHFIKYYHYHLEIKKQPRLRRAM